MAFEQTIQRVHDELIETFASLDVFFDLPSHLRQFEPARGEWSIDEILEHITLTNHFLMITLKQSLAKVLRRAQEQQIQEGESQLDKIVRISDPDAFGWIRPEHMEPTRNISSEVVRIKLAEQKAICMDILHHIKNGEGQLHRVRMSVQELGKLDMYEWLYFLVQHARRHVIEIERINSLYSASVTDKMSK